MAFRLNRYVVTTKQHFRISLRSLSFYPINENLFGLSSEQQQLRKTIFNFAQKELAPNATEIDKVDHFKDLREFWKKLGKLGLLGITVDPDYGGTGGTYLDNCIALEELSRVCAAISISYGTHSNLVLNQINKHGTDAQKRKYLPKLCSGEHIGALAMSEPEAGSDVVSMKLRAEKKGDYYVLNGNKFWITNGPDADVVLVYAKTDATKRQHGISAFLIEKGFPGFTAGPKLDKLGMRGSGTSELIFDNCKVPESNILGALNNGIGVLMSGLDLERMVMAAIPLGIMQAAVDTAFDYAHTRKQFGKYIGEFQMLQAKMADMHIKLNATRGYLYNVAKSCDNGDINPKDCAGVILFSAENSIAVAMEAIRILGGNGFINDYPTGRFLRDAQLGNIAAGTSEIRRLLIGRTLNREYLKIKT